MRQLLGSYKSKPADWQQYAFFDPHRYTRNLVDKGNGHYNVMILCWGAGMGSRCVHPLCALLYPPHPHCLQRARPRRRALLREDAQRRAHRDAVRLAAQLVQGRQRPHAGRALSADSTAQQTDHSLQVGESDEPLEETIVNTYDTDGVTYINGWRPAHSPVA